jgi:YLP motif-containing protein 1
VYKASLVKAFRKTVEEARFAFVIVDAPNLRVEDFKPYWDAGQVRGEGALYVTAPAWGLLAVFLPRLCLFRGIGWL